MEETFTPELLAKTYGGQLTVMTEVAEALRKNEGLVGKVRH